MNTKQYLKDIKTIQCLIDTQKAEIERLYAIAESMTPKIKEVNVMISQSNTREDTIIDIYELKTKNNARILLLENKKDEAKDIISEMRDYKQQAFLMKYYIQNKTLEQTAREMCIDYSGMCRNLKPDAEAAFSKKLIRYIEQKYGCAYCADRNKCHPGTCNHEICPYRDELKKYESYEQYFLELNESP